MRVFVQITATVKLFKASRAEVEHSHARANATRASTRNARDVRRKLSERVRETRSDGDG